ncbi:alanyl-tRNA editing protein [Thermogemmatispora sp.]|uniref:alanyl-tRNA editing protein n=1 Tax=Thermogemmatispora sp. TaxID=1968838 RepID=UPI001E061DB8|nr:alanyl-tRNA editing protein [Thermogemmatispora sp.]MBX5448462.1 alanyl-tRNA editing protein [Thermogemmatispora sp.]
MKTKLIYLENSYTFECSAKVVATEGDELALDATVFYPGGGGQMADRGTLSWDHGRQQARVIALRKQDEVVWHLLDCPPPPVGTDLTACIDWEFRYRMMRTHTALHLLCGVIWQEFRVPVTGGQMYPDRARMDFAMEGLTKERLAFIEQRVNEAIEADLPIRVYTLPREKAFAIPDLIRTRTNLLPPDLEEVRIVEIVGLDLQADGGTHVRHTKEVGGIRIVRAENKGRLNKRLEIQLVDEPPGSASGATQP